MLRISQLRETVSSKRTLGMGIVTAPHARGNASSRPDSLPAEAWLSGHPEASFDTSPLRTRALWIAAACLLTCLLLSFMAPPAQATSPRFVSAEVSSSGEEVVVTFSEEVFIHPMAKYVSNLVSGAPLELFIRGVMSVTIDGRTDPMTLSSLSGSKLRLRVSTPAIHSGQQVRVAYNNVFAVNAMSFGGLFVDADGNSVPNFSYQTVTNNSGIGGTVNIDAGPVISVDSLTIPEGGSKSYTVSLASQPSGEVTVDYPAFPPQPVSLNPSSLTFDQDDWNDPKTVTVTAAEDSNSFDAWTLLVNNHGTRPNRKASFLRVLIEDDDTPLDISGSTSISYAENGTSSVATYSVTNAGDSIITWKLFGKNAHGQDADDFSISSDGVLTFNSTPDYENPTDSNGDNTYYVTIEASNGSSTGVLLDVEITVTDVSPNVSVTPGTLSVDENAGNAQLTVELSAEHSDTVTVDWETADGTAVSGSDYTADSGMLSFSPGETQKTISVAISDDSLDEGNETFTVTLSNPSNADLAVSTSTVTIADNDTAVSLTPPVLSVNESAGSAQFMVGLGSAHTETVTVQWVTSDGTATAGEDYTAGGSTLSFAPNETSKTISVAIEDDSLDEGNETFTVTLSNPSNAVLGAASTSTVTITDNDTVGVSVTPQMLPVTEGRSDTYDVVLQSQPTEDVTVTIEVDPSGSDVSVNKQSLTFNSMNWSSVQTVTVSAEEDEDTDTDPVVRLNHTSTGGGYDGVSVPSVAVTVVEDDTSLVQMAQTRRSVNEGRSAQLTVRLSPAHSDTVTVEWETSSGTAGTDDYTEDSGTLSFSPGDTQKTISVVTADDSIDEDDEEFTVRLTGATSARLGAAGTSTVTITDNDTAGVTISPQVLSVDEGESDTYDVVLESEPTGDVTVSIEIDPPGEDVSVDDSTLTFTPRNWNAEQTVTVSAEEDTDTDVDRATLKHTFSGGGYGDIAPQTVTVTVLEDDTSLVQMAQTAVSVNEGAGSARLAVELSEAHSDDTVAVEWATSAGTATEDEDYTADSGTLRFSPGETRKTIDIAIEDDSLAESEETFTVTLSGESNAVLGASEATVTITDNDTAGVAVSSQVLSVNEGDVAVYGVALNSEPTGNVRVSIEINPPGGDVSVDDSILTFTPGNWDESQEVTVMAEEDEDTVPDSVTLSHKLSGGGYDDVSAPSVAVTVVEDDTAADGTLGEVPETADPDELRALLSLYDSAGGGNWRASTNWRSARPLGTWHGVTVDGEGRVTELDLGRNGLSGAVPTTVADLTRLRRLYLEENNLTAVPLAQLQALAEAQDSVFEELSLWGNELSGLESISDELGWRVDRAALRAFYESAGGAGWGDNGGWLSEVDPFSFSTWYGVLANDGGRVSEIDLSGNGLSGELTDGLAALGALERLDLSGNAELSGELPLGLAELPGLEMVDIEGTGVCAPGNAAFQRWLADTDFRGERCAGSGGEFEPPAGEGSGGGGCEIAFHGWMEDESKSAVFNLILAVFALVLVLRRKRV